MPNGTILYPKGMHRSFQVLLMYAMRVEDHVLRELHRAAADAGRRGISMPSSDLDTVTRRVGNREVAQKAIGRLVRAGQIVRVRKDLLVLPETTGLLGVDMLDLVDAGPAGPAPLTSLVGMVVS